MRINKKLIYILIAGGLIAGGIILVSFFYHSNPRQQMPKSVLKPKDTRDNLEKVNRFLVQKDAERIQSFVQRRGWDMNKTGSGLWYTIYDNNNEPAIQEGDYVKINYEIRLLDGTLCYASDSTGAKIIHVGMTEEVTALHEGLKMLGEGDRARLIVPPHLAYGLLGDSEKIPARAILVYDLGVLEVSDKKIYP